MDRRDDLRRPIPVTGLGITVGFHRYLTHGSFEATRWLRTTLAAAGSLAIEGPPSVWVADHRRHHAFSDRDGDPHSPWRYGESVGGMTLRAALRPRWVDAQPRKLQLGRFGPDLLADRNIRRIDRLFPAFVAVTLLGPAAIGGLATWPGTVSAFFWGALVRMSATEQAAAEGQAAVS